MIYQPRNVSPSGNSIDASKTNTFSMEIQTNTFVSYYQLIISDFDNNDIYTGNKTALDNYVYNGEYLSFEVANNIMTNGEDYKWRVKLYQQNADMQITYGIVQAEGSSTEIHISQNINIKSGMTISINGETKNITNYDLDTSVVTVESAFSFAPQIGDKYTINSDFIETVPDFIVYARKDPEVSINNIPGELTLKYHIFNGVYTQDNNVPIVYHQFNLYLKNSDNTFTLIDSSDKVYSANLTYSYDAFRTGNTYAIEMIVENDMNIISKTELYEFTVNYEIIEYLQQPTAQLDTDTNSVLVSWVTPVENEAIAKKTSDKSGYIQEGDNNLQQAYIEKDRELSLGDKMQIIANVPGKNILNNILQSQTINGITITVNSDKTITLNGTSTQEFYPKITESFKLNYDSYTLSTVSEMEDSKIKLIIRQTAQNTQVAQLFSGNKVTFENTYLEDVYIYLMIRANQTFDNFTIYPMLEVGTTNSEYEKYREIGARYEGIINSYDPTNGLVVLEEENKFLYSPMPGDNYSIISNIFEVGDFRFLYNTPYSTVNSLYTKGYEAEWSSDDGLCVMPDDFNISLQFNPDSDFFYNTDGNYIEKVDLIEAKTDDLNNNGNFNLSIDKNKFIFTMSPDINIEKPFYDNTNMVFVLNENKIPQINNDYIWDDNNNWNDDYFWVEGGTSLERICNHWWKIRITKTEIKIEEVYLS